jgi:hypothetical protein
MFHLEHIDLQSWLDKWHGQKATQRDIHLDFVLQEDFVIVQNLKSVQFILTLDYLYGPLVVGLPL